VNVIVDRQDLGAWPKIHPAAVITGLVPVISTGKAPAPHTIGMAGTSPAMTRGVLFLANFSDHNEPDNVVRYKERQGLYFDF
jgi:hypothetical protein